MSAMFSIREVTRTRQRIRPYLLIIQSPIRRRHGPIRPRLLHTHRNRLSQRHHHLRKNRLLPHYGMLSRVPEESLHLQQL